MQSTSREELQTTCKDAGTACARPWSVFSCNNRKCYSYAEVRNCTSTLDEILCRGHTH